MNIRDLKYLVTLADCKHFSKAAKLCFVSQPTLSMQLKKLEEQLGVQLLERTNKTVLLTHVGNLIVERARSILNQVDELQNISALAKDPRKGELKLGIIPTLGPYLLPHIIPSLKKSFSQLTLYLIEEKTAVLTEMLKTGKIDALLLALPLPYYEFVTEFLFEEEFMLAVPTEHKLATRKFIKQHDLNKKNLLLLEEGHCLREQALELCQKVEAVEENNFKATSLETLRHMVAMGIGITLIPKLACTPTKNIAYVPFVSPKPNRQIGLVWRNSAAKELLLKEISNEIKKFMLKIKL